MAERKIDAAIINTIKDYIAVVSRHYKVDEVYLFGSYAKGNENKDSDIDIAIISGDIKDRIGDMGKMFAMTWDVDTRIEPYPIRADDFYNRDGIMINEILRTGIPVVV